MDIASILKEILIVVMYMAIIPVGIGLYCWSYLNRPLRIFWLSILSGLSISVVGEYLIAKQITNTPLFYINTAIDGVLMTLFFSTYMTGFRLRRLFMGLCIILLLFMVWAIGFWGSSVNTALRLSTIESCLVVGMAFVVLTETLRHIGGIPLLRQPVVYLTVGVLLVNFFTLILNLLGAQLYTYSMPLFNLLWDTLAPLSNLIFYIFTCIGFWQSRFRAAQFG